MKSSLCTFALATLVAIASLTQAHAQTLASRVNVPFAFDCGSQHFAAGIYTISISDSGSVLTVTDYKHSDMAVIQSRSDEYSPSMASYVAFRKYGNSYFLSAYHAKGGVTVALGESAKERSLIRELASNPTDSGIVRLAMLNGAASGR
ncbi:MAG: hypothetical protein ABSG62_21875 [Terracidiphilus sp.]|jgi:hypothetical protein